MATVITAGNATNGLSLSADNVGAFEFKTGTGAGTTALTLSSAQVATFAGNVATPLGTLYPLVAGTAVASTSGTSIDFTGIPSWVKRITVMFDGVSVSGSSNPQIQLGDSGGIETTGYISVGTFLGSGVNGASYTTGFGFLSGGSTNVLSGSVIISLLNNNTFVATGDMAGSGGGAGFRYGTSGSKTLSATLDRIRITTVNGTDTFDAGSINILYE